jgi:hypothetical protein
MGVDMWKPSLDEARMLRDLTEWDPEWLRRAVADRAREIADRARAGRPVRYVWAVVVPGICTWGDWPTEAEAERMAGEVGLPGIRVERRLA